MTNAHSLSLVSVIVPVGERKSPIGALYAEYKAGLSRLGLAYELIFVLDGPPQPAVASGLGQLAAQGEPLTLVSLTRYFGEATGIMIGFEHAMGNISVPLPAYLQVEGGEIGKL